MAKSHIINSISTVLVLLFLAGCYGESGKNCTQSCFDLYNNHDSPPNGTLNSCCQRGCRFFSLMEASRKQSHIETEKSCIVDCADAYSLTDEWRACRKGCESQLPKENPEIDIEDGTMEFLYPMLQMHRMYNNMFDQMFQQLHVQYSYFIKKGSGEVVVIKSQPQLIVAFAEIDFTNDKTPLNPETNLETVDLSATPNVRHSQVRSLEGVETPYLQNDPQTFYSDWLNCMSNKTGMPHLIIILIVVVCVFVMVWLCFTAMSSGSSQKSKLSINGDLQYMKDMGMESLMKYESPHERIHGNKMPLKISIHKI